MHLCARPDNHFKLTSVAGVIDGDPKKRRPSLKCVLRLHATPRIEDVSPPSDPVHQAGRSDACQLNSIRNALTEGKSIHLFNRLHME